MNDRSVYEVSPEVVFEQQRKSAYMLFYSRNTQRGCGASTAVRGAAAADAITASPAVSHEVRTTGCENAGGHAVVVGLDDAVESNVNLPTAWRSLAAVLCQQWVSCLFWYDPSTRTTVPACCDVMQCSRSVSNSSAACCPGCAGADGRCPGLRRCRSGRGGAPADAWFRGGPAGRRRGAKSGLCTS